MNGIKLEQGSLGCWLHPCHPGCLQHLESHVGQFVCCCGQANHHWWERRLCPSVFTILRRKTVAVFIYYRYFWRISRWNPEPEVNLISAFWPSLPSHLDAAYEAHSRDSVFIFKGKNCANFLFCWNLTVKPLKYEFLHLLNFKCFMGRWADQNWWL